MTTFTLVPMETERFSENDKDKYIHPKLKIQIQITILNSLVIMPSQFLSSFYLGKLLSHNYKLHTHIMHSRNFYSNYTVSIL